jgi:hypothetical protein
LPSSNMTSGRAQSKKSTIAVSSCNLAAAADLAVAAAAAWVLLVLLLPLPLLSALLLLLPPNRLELPLEANASSGTWQQLLAVSTCRASCAVV